MFNVPLPTLHKPASPDTPVAVRLWFKNNRAKEIYLLGWESNRSSKCVAVICDRNAVGIESVDPLELAELYLDIEIDKRWKPISLKRLYFNVNIDYH